MCPKTNSYQTPMIDVSIYKYVFLHKLLEATTKYTTHITLEQHENIRI